MQSLAYTPPKPDKSTLGGATPVTIVSSKDADSKPQFPNLRLNGEQAVAAGLDKCAFGDEYDIKIRIRARQIGTEPWRSDASDDKPAMEFDVIEADTPKEVAGEVDKTKAIGVKAAESASKALSPSEAGMGDDEEEEGE